MPLFFDLRALLARPRGTGWIYLVVVLSGILSLAYVPGQLVVAGDAGQTLLNLRQSTDLFRLGIAAGMVCYLAFLVLPLSFYLWLAPAGRRMAQLMVLFAVVSVPISLGNLTHKLEVLDLVSIPQMGATLATEVMAALDRYHRGVLVAELFWGLWLIPLGILLLRSRAVPRLLGALLVVGGLGYLTEVFGTVLVADWRGGLFTRPAAFGEIGTCLWLLLFGARRPAPSTEPGRPARAGAGEVRP